MALQALEVAASPATQRLSSSIDSSHPQQSYFDHLFQIFFFLSLWSQFLLKPAVSVQLFFVAFLSSDVILSPAQCFVSDRLTV